MNTEETNAINDKEAYEYLKENRPVIAYRLRQRLKTYGPSYNDLVRAMYNDTDSRDIKIKVKIQGAARHLCRSSQEDEV